MTVYLDKKYICHAEPRDEYREAEHPYFDTVCKEAISCYRYIPERDFIQCIDSRSADMAQVLHENAELEQQLADIIEEIYSADIKRMQEE